MQKLKLWIFPTAVLGLLANAHPAAAAPDFGTDSARGRYIGNVIVTENFSDGTTTFHVEARLLAALTFDGKGGVTGATSVTVAVPGQTAFTCPYEASGTYQIGDAGLGSASLDMVSPLETCNGGVTLKMSVVIGGHNRRRMDVTIDRAISSVDGEIPLVGSGVLEK